MLGLLLDAGVLMAIVMFINDDETPSFLYAIVIALSMAVVFGLLLTFLAQFGLLGLLGGIPLLAAAAGLVLWITLSLEPLRAAIGGVIYLVYKLILVVVLVGMGG